MSKPDAPYFKRFTGEGEHLLDPLLNHPLLGGRDEFIQKHLVKNEAAPVQKKLLEPMEKGDEDDSIDEPESKFEENRRLEDLLAENQPMSDEDSDEDSMESKSAKDQNAFTKHYLNARFKSQHKSPAGDSSNEI